MAERKDSLKSFQISEGIYSRFHFIKIKAYILSNESEHQNIIVFYIILHFKAKSRHVIMGKLY